MTCLADDTNLLASSNNVQDLGNVLLSEVTNVDGWATNNKVPLHGSKTKIILIEGQCLGKRFRNEDRKL